MVNRIEPTLTERFKKDPSYEEFLKKFNSILAPYQEQDYVKDLPELFPTVHVIGVPRSGTTLITQLLAAHTNIGYINNLIAAFWKAPVYGIRLSEQVVPRNLGSSYQSQFGRTKGIHEPHEFGYFWSELLNYKEMKEQPDKSRIDWDRVRLVLTNMTNAIQRPIIFKSVLLAWHILEMQSILPKTCWIHIYRDPIQNSLSLLKFRQQFLGSIEKWVSLKPKEYSWLKDRPYWEQVAGQVYFLDKRYRNQMKQLPPDNFISVSYESLCKCPQEVIEKVLQMVNKQGFSLEMISTPPTSFEIQQFDIEAHPDGQNIINAWEMFNNEFGPISLA